MSGSNYRNTGGLILALVMIVAATVHGGPVLINTTIGASGGSCGSSTNGIQCTVGQPFIGGTDEAGGAMVYEASLTGLTYGLEVR